MGLFGSTLLIWGDVVSDQGTAKFRTRFSYEFGYSAKISQTEAQRIVREYIDSFINKGLFFPVKNTRASLEDNLLVTSLFILGFTTFSLGQFDNATILYEKFREHYRNASLMQQADFASANSEVKKSLAVIYIYYVNNLLRVRHVDREKVKKLCQKILTLNSDYYSVHMILARMADEDGDRSSAIFHTDNAEAVGGNQFAHVFNRAYFALSEGRFDDAIAIYENIPKEGIGVDISSAANYLDDIFLRNKVPAYQFGDGYITYTWGDRDRGKKILKSFVDETRDPKYKSLIDFSSKLCGF